MEAISGNSLLFIPRAAASSRRAILLTEKPPLNLLRLRLKGKKKKKRCFTNTNAVEIQGFDAASDIISAANDVAAAAPVDISWQTVVGSLAGIAPFIVAAIEFGKRIIEQKNCEICRGSGLLLKKDYYIRCPSCGGFLPWQSWKRFFTG